MIKAVVFDLDGTFYSKTILGLKFLFRHPLHFHRLMRFLRVREKLRPLEEIRRKQYEILSTIENRPFDVTRKYYDDLIYNKLFSLTPKARKDAMLTISKLEAAGYKLGILTEYPYEIKLKRLGFRESQFQIIINLEDYGILKPKPECFGMLVTKSQLEPEEIMYVGDRLDTDVIGANSFGIRSCIISKKRIGEADHSIRDFSDLTRIMNANS